jgi:hypothetical protein
MLSAAIAARARQNMEEKRQRKEDMRRREKASMAEDLQALAGYADACFATFITGRAPPACFTLTSRHAWARCEHSLTLPFVHVTSSKEQCRGDGKTCSADEHARARRRMEAFATKLQSAALNTEAVHVSRVGTVEMQEVVQCKTSAVVSEFRILPVMLGK